MAFYRFRLIEDEAVLMRPRPRIASADDRPVESPAQLLQVFLRAAATGERADVAPVEKYPVLVRLVTPVLASAVLWAAILRLGGVY